MRTDSVRAAVFPKICQHPLGAFGADAVAEDGVAVAGDIDFDLTPVALVVANLFAVRTDG